MYYVRVVFGISLLLSLFGLLLPDPPIELTVYGDIRWSNCATNNDNNNKKKHAEFGIVEFDKQF